jgi:hypothetical protein
MIPLPILNAGLIFCAFLKFAVFISFLFLGLTMMQPNLKDRNWRWKIFLMRMHGMGLCFFFPASLDWHSSMDGVVKHPRSCYLVFLFPHVQYGLGVHRCSNLSNCDTRTYIFQLLFEVQHKWPSGGLDLQEATGKAMIS